MIILGWVSDKQRNRGLWTQVGWLMEIVAFVIWLTVPSTNHQARFGALVIAEAGHYGG